MQIWIIALYIVTAVIFLYRIAKIKKVDLVLILAALAYGCIFFYLEHAAIYLIPGIIIFNAIMFTYGSKINYVLVAVGALYLVYIYFNGLGILAAQPMLLGMLSGITLLKSSKNKERNKVKEINRDIVQILLGAAIILICYLCMQVIGSLVFLFVTIVSIGVATYVLNNKRTSLGKLLYRFERNDASFGHGAAWLMLGGLLAMSYLNGSSLIVVFIAIFLGDALATIVGIKIGGPKLSYNRSKSISGTIAYFLIVSILGYYLIGVPALLIGAVAAIVESLPIKIDDNFTVATVLTLIFFCLTLV